MSRAHVLEVDPDLALTADEVVGRRLVDAHRSLAGATLRVFDLIVELEESQGYLPRYADVASWVRWHLGVTARTARLYVRIARSFDDFLLIREAFGAGEISLDQVQLLLRVATEDNQTELVEMAG